MDAVLNFSDGRMMANMCFFKYLGFRPPNKGEWYLSGAIVEAYRAPSDLSVSFHVVEPTHKAVKQTGYVKGEAI